MPFDFIVGKRHEGTVNMDFIAYVGAVLRNILGSHVLVHIQNVCVYVSVF